MKFTKLLISENYRVLSLKLFGEKNATPTKKLNIFQLKNKIVTNNFRFWNEFVIFEKSNLILTDYEKSNSNY